MLSGRTFHEGPVLMNRLVLLSHKWVSSPERGRHKNELAPVVCPGVCSCFLNVGFLLPCYEAARRPLSDTNPHSGLLRPQAVQNTLLFFISHSVCSNLFKQPERMETQRNMLNKTRVNCQCCLTTFCSEEMFHNLCCPTQQTYHVCFENLKCD